MKLKVQKRTTGKKGETNKLRREGGVPAVLYTSEGVSTAVSLDGDELKAILRNMRPGLLSTTVFELSLDGKPIKAIVKDVQYHVASYDVEHIDFLQLTNDKPVNVNVPIQLVGAADCSGVKLGGFLRQVIRFLKVTCLPKHIPQELSVDVRDLAIAESKRLSDVQMPAGVTPRAKMDEVVVIVGKKAGV